MSFCIDFIFSQVQHQFTADQHAHYIFTPHDLTRWIQSLLHYGLHELTEETSLLEVFAYKARWLLRDHLHSRKQAPGMFDAPLVTILMKEWSFASGSLVEGDGVYFTTFGVSGSISHTKLSQGHALGILSESDLSDTLSRTMKQYSEYTSDCYIWLQCIQDVSPCRMVVTFLLRLPISIYWSYTCVLVIEV